MSPGKLTGNTRPAAWPGKNAPPKRIVPNSGRRVQSERLDTPKEKPPGLERLSIVLKKC
jgi:hypothetical protein